MWDRRKEWVCTTEDAAKDVRLAAREHNDASDERRA
jgi:hypothetical protein